MSAAVTLLQLPCEGLFGQCVGHECPAWDVCTDEDEEE